MQDGQLLFFFFYPVIYPEQISKPNSCALHKLIRLAPVVSAFVFHSLTLPVAVFVSLIPFHIFSTKGHNLSNHYKLY